MAKVMGEILELIQACASGDPAARRQFQDEYGEDIYNFPVKIYRLPLDEAGDFYLYVFENDRIFTRMATFAGRNNIQFRTFLSYYVLKHLFLEWRRTQKEVATVSLSTPLGGSSEGGQVLEDVLPDQTMQETEETIASESRETNAIWAALTPEERLDLKLLSLIECDLTPEDVRLLAKATGRSIQETLAVVAEVQAGLKRKDERISQLRDDLDSVWGWILLRQRELQEITEKIRRMGETPNATTGKLRQKKHELEQALVKRSRQKEKSIEELRSYKLTTPYKDIARLLNLTVGTVCSRIFRLRERLTREFGEAVAC
jgi:RNA polymerase sigma factor (sigma-70 family)